jgi:hypothetical protein
MLTLLILVAVYGAARGVYALYAAVQLLPRCNEDMVLY